MNNIIKKYLPAAAAAAALLLYWYSVSLLGAKTPWAGVAIGLVFVLGRLLAEQLGLRQKGLLHTGSVVLGLAVLAALALAGSITRSAFTVQLGFLALLAFSLFYARSRGLCVLRTDAPASEQRLLCLLFVLLLGLYFFAGAVPNAHPAAVGAITPNQDFFWNVGNAESFFLGFPPEDLRFAGLTVTYHYLTELLSAGLAMLSGCSCYDALAFYLPPALLLSFCAVLWESGGRLLGKGKQQMLLLLFVFGTACAGLYKTIGNAASPFLNFMPVHLITNINAVTTGLLFFLAFVIFFFEALENPNRPLMALALLSYFGMILAKGPMAGIAAIAAICTLTVLCLRKKKDKKRLLALMLVLGGGFLLVYRLLFSAGAASSMQLSLTGTLQKSYFKNYLALFAAKNTGLYFVSIPFFMLAQTVLFMPAVAPVWIAGALRDVKHLGLCPAWRLFCHAVTVGGMAAFFLFDHANLSQIYFAFIAVFAASLIAAEDLPRFWQKLQAKKSVGHTLHRALILCCVGVGVLTACFTYGGMIGRGVSQLQHGAAAARSHATRAPLTKAEEMAMDWLRVNMPKNALFATNRIHTGTAAEGLSNVYTGLSGRKSYMESFKYAVSNMGAQPEEVAERIRLIEALFRETTSPEAAQTLCRKAKIEYIVYTNLLPGSTAPLAEFRVLYQNENVVIYKAA